MSKLLSLSLPVGAYLGGWRHAGGGNFVAEIADKSRKPEMVLDGATSGETWPLETTVEVVDGVGKAEMTRAFTVLVPVENGQRLNDGCTPETLAAMAQRAGLVSVEPGLWNNPADVPASMGWYEIECAVDGLRVFGLWNGAQLGWLPFVGMGCTGKPVISKLPSGFDAKSARWREAGFSVVPEVVQ